MRTAIAVLLVAPWSTSGQTAEDQKLNEVLAKLRACVRTYAPAIQAKDQRNAIDRLIDTCTPSLIDLVNGGLPPIAQPGAISLSDMAGVGAVSPGLFRQVVREALANGADHPRTR